MYLGNTRLPPNTLLEEKIMLSINNGWDVAHLLMHSSFDELHEAHSLCNEASEIEVNTVEDTECFSLAQQVEYIDDSVKKHLVKSVILFQAGMEAILNWLQSIDTSISNKGSFSEKWEKAFKSKGVDYDFSYYRNFYENYRIHIVHPDKDERFETINTLKFYDVYEGVKSGWLADAALSEAVGNKHDKNSWKIMCNAHQLPSSINTSTYPNPQEIARHLRLRYRKHLNTIKP